MGCRVVWAVFRWLLIDLFQKLMQECTDLVWSFVQGVAKVQDRLLQDQCVEEDLQVFVMGWNERSGFGHGQVALQVGRFCPVGPEAAPLLARLGVGLLGGARLHLHLVGVGGGVPQRPQHAGHIVQGRPLDVAFFGESPRSASGVGEQDIVIGVEHLAQVQVAVDADAGAGEPDLGAAALVGEEIIMAIQDVVCHQLVLLGELVLVLFEDWKDGVDLGPVGLEEGALGKRRERFRGQVRGHGGGKVNVQFGSAATQKIHCFHIFFHKIIDFFWNICWRGGRSGGGGRSSEWGRLRLDMLEKGCQVVQGEGPGVGGVGGVGVQECQGLRGSRFGSVFELGQGAWGVWKLRLV